MIRSVTTSYLEMLHASDLQPRSAPRPDLSMARTPFAMPELNRFFYSAVGGGWYWSERLVWTYQQWMNYLDRPELQTWIVNQAGVPAGYFELEKQADNDVEIVYFGLLAQFTEQGMGGWALTQAVEKAWLMGARRVWLHTCDHDHPRALPNYLARGFRLFKTETKLEELPARTPGPWPGAYQENSCHVNGTE